MKKTLGLLGALMVAGFGVLAISAPAQAEPTSDCKSVSFNLTDRPDTGTGGHVWAKDKMTRTMKVCAEAASGDVLTSKTTWQYSAIVTDTGTFVTNAGKTPRGEVGLPADVTGTVNGNFHARFTAESNFGDWTETGLKNDTPTSQWVKAVMPSANGNLVYDYLWKYETTCESYTDHNDDYTGDIAGKICAPTAEFTNATCKDAKAHVKVTNPNSHVTLAVAFNGDAKTIAKSGSVTYDLTSGKGVLEARKFRAVYEYKAPTGCPTPSASPTTPKPTTSPIHTTTPPVAGGNDNGSGGLPVTGAKAVTIFGVGGAVLVIGAIAYVAARKRRDTQFVAE